MTRDFHIGDILSITTGMLVSPSHMGGVYGILNWMTSDNLYTHQLPRACGECAPELPRQFPQFAGLETPAFEGEADVMVWVSEMARRFGETFPVAKMAGDDHARIDPVQELRSMLREDQLIMPIVIPEEGL